jgi:beta-lactamase regulating signal transducer with metallopeptidase domain
VITMSTIEALMRQPAAEAVAWALIQFVWQGAAIGAVTALALTALRRSAADVRYVVGAVSLSLMLTLPAVTAVQKYQSLVIAAGVASVTPVRTAAVDDAARPVTEPVRATRESAGITAAAADVRTGVVTRLSSIPVDRLLPTLMLVWIAGVAALSLRLLTGWLWVQRLRTHGVSAASEHCQRLSARLSRRLHIGRAITLLESTLVDVPTVIGFLKPVVLLPASALGGLTPQQLEAILAHELAHIRRHDYMVNLLQTLVETVLFYHPAA